MRRTIAILGLLVLTGTANAHFIWIIPVQGKNEVRVVMSETPEPDSPALLDKIAHTEMQVRLADGKAEKLKWSKGGDAFVAAVPGQGHRTVGGVCKYGVMQRGNADPFLLMYYAKTDLAGSSPTAKKLAAPWQPLALEIMPTADKAGTFQVLWNGKPLADAEVVVTGEAAGEGAAPKTDMNGLFNVALPKPGVYGFRVRHIEPKTGEHEGKKYKEVRHYSTYVVHLGEGKK